MSFELLLDELALQKSLGRLTKTHDVCPEVYSEVMTAQEVQDYRDAIAREVLAPRDDRSLEKCLRDIASLQKTLPASEKVDARRRQENHRQAMLKSLPQRLENFTKSLRQGAQDGSLSCEEVSILETKRNHLAQTLAHRGLI